MKKGQIILGVALLLGAVLLFSMVSAANTAMMVYPNTTNNNRISGTIFLNASLDTNTANMTNLSFYRRANSHTGSWTYIGSVANTSAQQTSNWVLSFASTALIDDRNHEFNVTGANITGAVLTNALASNISIDNGVPTVSFSSASIADKENRQIDQAFTIAINADNTIGIINCTIAFNFGTPLVLTASNNACSDTALTSSNFSLTIGAFNYTITGYDDNGNSTVSQTRELSFAPSGGFGGGAGGGSNNIVVATESTESSQTALSPPNTRGFSSFISRIASWFRNLFN